MRGVAMVGRDTGIGCLVVCIGLTVVACTGGTESTSFGSPCTSDEDCAPSMQCVRVDNRLVCAEPYDDSSEDTGSETGRTDAGDTGEASDVTVADTSDSGADTDDGASVPEDTGGSRDTNDGSDGASPIPDHTLLGGGTSYVEARKRDGKPTFCQPPAEASVVSSRSEFVDALEAASAGDVVYVAAEASIELGVESTIRIPDGVTVASNRGCDGADGGQLYVEQDNKKVWKVLAAGSDVRLTGLSIAGPREAFDPQVHANGEPISIGVRVDGGNFEFDNNNIHGFSHAAIQVHAEGPVHIHHNRIHHNPVDGLGYGVAINEAGGGDEVLIEYNEMNHNRHSIASSGASGYEARYNHFGPEGISYAMGTHHPGGTTMKIHHNTVELVKHLAKPDEDVGPSIVIRRMSPRSTTTGCTIPASRPPSRTGGATRPSPSRSTTTRTTTVRGPTSISTTTTTAGTIPAIVRSGRHVPAVSECR
ncbi:MAG: right-handed parallel beta-helix repeat-containing protein [Bradymonadaceae bacterium]